MRYRVGFSLVELLVVIGIIGMLISILLPTLGKARESAKAVQCASQLRQLGQAIHAYASSNRGMTPAWSMRHEYPVDPYLGDPNAPGWTGPGWPVLLEGYIGQKPDGAIYNCPSFPDDQRRINYFMGARWMRAQEPMLRSMPMSRIKASSLFVMSGDCTSQSYYPPPFGTETNPRDDIDKDDAGIKCLSFFPEDQGGYNMHRAGNNVLFADGHVAIFRKFEAQSMTYSPYTMKRWEDVGPE
jgi:prepilin-type processing-associated H-X9-DG protein/prepilin-type N-terminal cleavage/methylation domain-containing protein